MQHGGRNTKTTTSMFQVPLHQRRTQFELTPQLCWDVYQDSGEDPIFILRGAFKGYGDSLLQEDSGVAWRDYGNRKHAFLCEFPTEYTFANTPLSSLGNGKKQHEEKAWVLISNLARLVGMETARGKYQLGNLRGLELPIFNAANLALYEAGGSLGLHKDNEPQHARPFIASVSFGATASMLIGKFDKVELRDGDLLLFNRMILHGIGDCKGKRVNVTLRAWSGKPCYYADRLLPGNDRYEKQPQPKRKHTQI